MLHDWTYHVAHGSCGALALASSTGVAKGNDTDRLAFLDHVPGRLSGAKQVLVHDRFQCQVGRNDVEICSHHVPDDELGYAAEDKERDPRHWDTAQLGAIEWESSCATRDAKNKRQAANAVLHVGAYPQAECHRAISSFRWAENTRRRS